jgi:hypothetical protein
MRLMLVHLAFPHLELLLALPIERRPVSAARSLRFSQGAARERILG